MTLRTLASALILFSLFTACSSSAEENLIANYFDSLYGEKRSDTLQARMLPFFGDDVKNNRLPIYSTKSRLAEKIKSHSIENWQSTEKDDRLTISGTILEDPRRGAIARKGFIARFAKQFSPGGKESIWMLYDLVFSSQPVKNSKAWIDLVGLSKTSRSLVEGITNKVEILLFGRFADDPVLHILRELSACIPNQVSFSWLDPDIDRGLAAGYGITRTPHIVIENGQRRAVLQVSDLYQDEGLTEEKTSRVLMAERKLVAALLRVAGPPVELRFITGLLSREMSSAKTDAITKFVKALSNSGYLLKNMSLDAALTVTAASNTNAPAEAKNILVFADPRLGLSAWQDTALSEQLRNGQKRALFLMDTPLTPWGASLAARFGFAYLHATVVDPANKDSFRGARWIESLIYQHAAVQHFYRRPNFRVLIAEAAGFVPMQTKPTNFKSSSIVSSSSNGWGETEFDKEKPDEFEYTPGRDIPGPIHLGFAVSTPSTNSQPVAVFMGDCDFVANELAQSRISNWLFSADLLDWLIFPEVQAIASRPYSSSSFKHLQ